MAERREKLDRIRSFMGKKLKETQAFIPHVTGVVELDLTELNALNDELTAQGHKMGLTPLILKGLSIALLEFPKFNTRQEGDEVIYYDHVNPGIAVQTPMGLNVFCLREVDTKDVFQISTEFRELMNRVRNKKITMDDTYGGTFTFSNLTKSRNLIGTSIVNNNETLLVSANGITKRAVVLPDGTIAAHDCTYLCSNINHTIVDGGDNVEFMGRVLEILEDPRKYIM